MDTLYERERSVNNGHLCWKTSKNTETIANPKKIAEFKCNCKFLWLKEVHGLSALMMAKQLKFPTLVFCPKYGDALHLEPLLQDMRLRLGFVDEEVGYDVLRYLIAGSGLDKVKLGNWNAAYILELNSLYKNWRGNRTQDQMFDFVFNENGYTCAEMFQECYAGSLELDCCKVFEPTFVMMRGRCVCADITLRDCQ
ncbi:unnamed protein product [Strongylus vulgaris]|uniref:Uncharacterized protein n=1 Tax=Strongylus vulgaris TaxID=40348 RepID=A0A3P7LIT2_STRVU|nr:unnamed protein product [Strongylus vulgaris]